MVRKFSFFESYHEAMEGMTDEQRLALYDAMCAYAFDGAPVAFDDVTLRLAWTLIQPTIDNSVKGFENGSKGGRPKGVKTPSETPSEPTRKPDRKPMDNHQAKGVKTPSETVMDMDMDGEGEMEEEVENLIKGSQPSSSSGDARDGWSETACKCGFHKGTRMLRAPDGEIVCPMCHPEVMG